MGRACIAPPGRTMWGERGKEDVEDVGCGPTGRGGAIGRTGRRAPGALTSVGCGLAAPAITGLEAGAGGVGAIGAGVGAAGGAIGRRAPMGRMTGVSTLGGAGGGGGAAVGTTVTGEETDTSSSIAAADSSAGSSSGTATGISTRGASRGAPGG